MKKIASIDRFEKDVAVLLFEGVEGSYEFPRKILPPECNEGDIIIVEIALKENESKKRLKKSLNLIKRLTNHNEE
ncbi:DUF3006 domain-containing protein [Candidatus Oleimmundimicrobium sp.]|uniref:DUF3006 domain-containing protein n=1 Tax=Candidatus Oleimmundimicrobium sp. TaxID=3060597 RepID=UPI002715797B|nr:DUF3006 domain-containing protein [Candidatus Oleimmundimicrobium sp.]MDO8885320.1 DUF3006 domain-containing protein [Candidatus Oleimmundimicrobium sp.]